ncbi:glycosyltransferase family 4 protein [Zeaxanthinibacter sp. PT1]|uniref:glycosyltransferase family 4 protein n=1 Tax=Zeaxanthinibacter TaxID=561554 RepID=UPI00234B02A5|nr:glycosyltransferase family 4 protein [Zeaxanthinibacter sp. PT1]MDC6350609.1 glycosyltransferase family 4 protein [Zeaxanthinibacter sp. PT1]
MIEICHISTVHHRYDTRIFIKQCRSLVKASFRVHLVVADGLGNEEKDGVIFWDIGRPVNRKERLLKFRKKMYQQALAIEASVYHFHDPELLGVGKKLIAKGKKVIYDTHEDVPRQLLTKAYLPSWLRKALSYLFERYENHIAAKLSGIIAATPHIRDRFLKVNPTVIEVQNFPFLEEFNNAEVLGEKEDAVCYVGAISKVRGILQIVEAMSYLDNGKLLLGGKFENEDLRNRAVSVRGWSQVEELGFLSRTEVNQVMQRSVAGLVVLEPTISYLDSIPVKMFEYMAAGIPVIASDFPYWRTLLKDTDCALFVDPNNPEAIAGAIARLISDRALASKMGEIGRNAAVDIFNWDQEEKKLLNFYKRIIHEAK